MDVTFSTELKVVGDTGVVEETRLIDSFITEAVNDEETVGVTETDSFLPPMEVVKDTTESDEFNKKVELTVPKGREEATGV